MPKTDQIEKDISNSMEQSKQSLEKKNKKKSSKNQKETIKKLDQLEKNYLQCLRVIAKRLKLKILKH